LTQKSRLNHLKKKKKRRTGIRIIYYFYMNESSTTLVAATLRNAVWHYLDQDLLETAAFTAERLQALEEASGRFGGMPISSAAVATRHLLATVYYRLGRYQTVMDLCNKVAHVGCLYLYARCCLKLGKLSLGISALEDKDVGGKELYRTGGTSGEEGGVSPATLGHDQRLVLPTPAMINVLLGDLYRATGMEKRAVLSYGLALRMDPLCWEASKALCEFGVEIKSAALYAHFSIDMLPDPANPTIASINHNENNNNSSSSNNNNSTSSNTNNNNSNNNSIHDGENHDPFLSKPKPTFAVPSSRLKQAATRQHSSSSSNSSDILVSPIMSRHALAVSGATTPEFGSRSLTGGSIPKTPVKRTGISARSQLAGNNTNNSSINSSSSSHEVSAPRRSSRLAAAAATASSSARKSTVAPRFGTPSSPIKKASLLRSATTSTLSSDRHDALRLLTNLYSTYTRSYYLFCRYACDDALNALAQLPPAQQNTPWVIAKQARIYFEKVQYHKSLEYFERLREVDPFRLEDMEYYSTLLWHLQQDVELTHLAAYLVSVDRRAPQAWCAVGNALSLNRDTENALRCFQRAVHLDSTLAYAYTLQAHEYVASDSYEHAQDCYRQALRADKRHYNAWYGLGMVFLRLGNNDMAELHFRKASAINPINVVLLCCIGMVLEKSGEAESALAQYTQALTIQPASALSLYKRARLLVKLGSYELALADLHKLVAMAPDEASVHFLIGQIHKTLHNKTLAVREFTIALNLDPKGAHMIKEALERLEEDEDEDRSGDGQ
jgi:anaphase-promoting complex subunit 3